MHERLSGSMISVAIATAVGAGVSTSVVPVGAQTATISGTPTPATAGLKTSWGEPDLQGIWLDETDTPLQRPAKYGNQEFFTAAQRQELDRERSVLLNRDRRLERGSERDVSGAYNTVFLSLKHVGARTSLIIAPPNGRIPPLTPAAQSAAASDRQFRLALVQSTDTCKDKSPRCAGGKYDPIPSPRRGEAAPRYLASNFGYINRYDGPEDASLAVRCLHSGLPDFGSAFGGSLRRIVQTPGGISIFYDLNQGQGFQRNIVMSGSPHLPTNIRQWFGDSRGHWEGDTLVVDVTNFSPKTDFQGSRENLHLVERWTRISPTTIDYEVTVEDPTVWTRPWTVKQEFSEQSDNEDRIYYEPRCIEGNYGLPGILHGHRQAERAFAEGQGPDPATRDDNPGGLVLEEDPLQN